MAIFEAILIKNSEKKNVYLFRHYVNFIIGFLTIILTYKISRIKFSRNIALIISIFFMSTPIIVSNFNFNPNDIWFMFFVSLSTFCSLKLINKPDSKLLIFLLPLSLAFSINIRLVGIYIFFIFLIFYIYEKISLKKKLFNISIIVSLFIFITLLITPQLWNKPTIFLHLLFGQLKFQAIDVDIMFLGNLIKSSELPWYYLLVWIIISLPSLIICCFVGSLIIISKNFFKKKFQVFEMFILMALVIPIIAFCILKPNLFNGWRHFYFIFPFILILSGFILNFFEKKIILKQLMILIVVINTILIGTWNFKNNPHQYIFFNLPSKKFARNFELDYWGVSNLEALKYLLNMNTSERIHIANFKRSRADFSVNMLTKKQQHRIRFVKFNGKEKIDYFINHINDGKNQSYYKDLGYNLIKVIKSDGIVINSIYEKIKN